MRLPKRKLGAAGVLLAHSLPLTLQSPPFLHRVRQITWRVAYAHNTAFLDRVAAKAEAMSSNTFMPDPVLFSKLFPFHFIMDARLNIVQVGQGVLKVVRGNNGRGMLVAGCVCKRLNPKVRNH